MIPYQKILAEAPVSLRKRLALIVALARHTTQDHRAAAANARSGPTIRETEPELAALWQWLILKYSADQPRVPAGSRDGGQWTKDGATETSSVQIARNRNDTSPISDATPDNMLIPVAGWEHHYVPWGTFKKYNLLSETRKIFVDATSGPLEDITANKWGPEHATYNEAVDEAFKSFLKRNNIPPEEAWRLTPAQAEEFLDEVFYSSDPRIRLFNMRIWRESFKYWRRSGGGRGRGGDEE